MNARPENYEALIVFKMTAWRELAYRGLDKRERIRARRNYLQLIRNHVDIDELHGFMEESAFE